MSDANTDLISAAYDAEWEEAEEEVSEEIEDASEAGSAESPIDDVEVSGETAEASEDPAEDDAEAVADIPAEFVMPEKLAGKSAEEIAKAYVEHEKLQARQASELGDLRKQTGEQAQQLEQLLNVVGQMQQETTAGYFEEQGLENPAQTYQQMLGLVGEGQLPVGEVSNFIERVYELDPTMGRHMDRDFNARIMRAEMIQQIQPVQQNNYGQMLENVTSELYDDPNLGPDVKEFEKEIIGALTPLGSLGSSPSEIRASLIAALNAARGSDPTRSNVYRSALADRRTSANVEAGSPPPPASLSQHDQARERVFKHRATDPADFFLQPLSAFTK